MKTIIFSLLSVLPALAFPINANFSLDANELTTLPEISKPYVGVYECEELYFGGEEWLGRFDFLELSLERYGEYVLRFREKGGRSGETKGKYSYSIADSTLTLEANVFGETKRRTFSVEKGVVGLTFPLGEKVFLAKFKMR